MGGRRVHGAHRRIHRVLQSQLDAPQVCCDEQVCRWVPCTLRCRRRHHRLSVLGLHHSTFVPRLWRLLQRADPSGYVNHGLAYLVLLVIALAFSFVATLPVLLEPFAGTCCVTVVLVGVVGRWGSVGAGRALPAVRTLLV